MKRYTIILPKQLCDDNWKGLVTQIAAVLKEFGVNHHMDMSTLNGDYGVSFDANLSPIQHRLICAYLESISADVPIQFEEVNIEFMMGKYYGTKLNMTNIEFNLFNMLNDFSEIIADVLHDTSMEYQQQARIKIANHCIYHFNAWSGQIIKK
jgi:hypothetical protein